MAKLIKFEPSRTYATEMRAHTAVRKLYGRNDQLRYFIQTTPEGRFFPVFIGQEALAEGVHFHFNVVG